VKGTYDARLSIEIPFSPRYQEVDWVLGPASGWWQRGPCHCRESNPDHLSTVRHVTELFIPDCGQRWDMGQAEEFMFFNRSQLSSIGYLTTFYSVE
jgi:hypothetical protein